VLRGARAQSCLTLTTSTIQGRAGFLGPHGLLRPASFDRLCLGLAAAAALARATLHQTTPAWHGSSRPLPLPAGRPMLPALVLSQCAKSANGTTENLPRRRLNFRSRQRRGSAADSPRGDARSGHRQFRKITTQRGSGPYFSMGKSML